ncbi:MAG: cytochrome c oxidase subunit II [Cyclobacteriaceae bacterium]|nr:cytochrome c oxidase subunit II [Cyclobacteriaceae bacterium]MCH8515173.1 cytochrome c oxidase subunit II [Cyclobacteriaceae bacterium]
MFNLLVGAGVLLVLVILYLLFRIQSLIGIAKKSKNIESTSNNVNANLFILFLIVGFGAMFYYSYVNFDKYTLPVASEHGPRVDSLFWWTMGITGVAFILTHILLFIFPKMYKYDKNRRAFYYPVNNKLEFLWTVVPFVVLSILIFSGFRAWTDITAKAPDDAEVVEIMGYQFAWSVRYPGNDGKLGNYDFRIIDATNEFGIDFSDANSFDDFTTRKVVIPKGKPVLFKIRARDVLHSVFAPHFRLKMDAVPGMPTSFWFTPTKSTSDMRQETGNENFKYEIACTEICGRGHFSMKLEVEVLEPAQYEEWYASQKSFLDRNEDYLAKVPEKYRDLAMEVSGIKDREKGTSDNNVNSAL